MPSRPCHVVAVVWRSVGVPLQCTLWKRPADRWIATQALFDTIPIDEFVHEVLCRTPDATHLSHPPSAMISIPRARSNSFSAATSFANRTSSASRWARRPFLQQHLHLQLLVRRTEVGPGDRAGQIAQLLEQPGLEAHAVLSLTPSGAGPPCCSVGRRAACAAPRSPLRGFPHRRSGPSSPAARGSLRRGGRPRRQ